MNLLIVNADTDMGEENVIEEVTVEEYGRFENLLEKIKDYTKGSNYEGIPYHKRSLVAKKVLTDDEAKFMSKYIPYSGSSSEIYSVRFVECSNVTNLYNMEEENKPSDVEDED